MLPFSAQKVSVRYGVSLSRSVTVEWQGGMAGAEGAWGRLHNFISLSFLQLSFIRPMIENIANVNVFMARNFK